MFILFIYLSILSVASIWDIFRDIYGERERESEASDDEDNEISLSGRNEKKIELGSCNILNVFSKTNTFFMGEGQKKAVAQQTLLLHRTCTEIHILWSFYPLHWKLLIVFCLAKKKKTV